MTTEQAKRRSNTGINKWVAIPAVIFVLGLFGTYYSYATATKQDPSYYPIMYGCMIVAMFAFIIAAVMQNSTFTTKTTTVVAEPAQVHDHSELYYAIYTTGKRKNDVDFIERIADKIEHIDETSDPVLKSEVAKLFAAPVGTPVLIPEELTGGEKVYQRLVKSTQLVDSITRNDRHIAVLTFDDNSKAVIVRHEELHEA